MRLCVEKDPHTINETSCLGFAAIDHAFTEGMIHFCANAVLVTALLPYVSPIVLPGLDVQLMALAISTAVLIVLFLCTPWLLRPCRTDFYVLGIGLFTLVYINPNIPGADMTVSLRACAPIILGFPVYFAIRNLYQYMSPRVFIAVVVFYFCVLMIQLWFPGAYTSLFSHFLSDTRFAPEQGRGPNGLTTEPSMMGDMCLLFIVSLYFFHRRYWIGNRSSSRVIVALSGLMLYITESATGIVLAITVALATLFSSKLSTRAKALTVSGMLIGAMVLGEMLSLSDIRGALILSTISKNPILAFQDESLAARCTNIFVGIYQLPVAPFGNGDVRPNVELTGQALNGDIATHLWPDWRFRDLFVDMIASRENISGIGGMIQRMGIFGIFVALCVVHFIRGFPGKWVVRTFVLGLFFNASMFISTLWFIVGCCVSLQLMKSEADGGTAVRTDRNVAQ
jgi:hypothetical protein